MKVKAPPLLPLLRSATQARLLTILFMDSDREYTLTELASRAETSLPTVTREVDRAAKAEIITRRKVGRSAVVKANTESWAFEPLRELLLRAFGPAPVVAEEFANVSGLDQVCIFGSWAARYTGEEGHLPRDIDVLVVGEPVRDLVYDAAERAEQRLHRPVQVTVRTSEQWQNTDRDPFLREVRRRPLVELIRPRPHAAV